MSGKVILIVTDSLGVGAMPDAAQYGDAGADTFGHIWRHCGGLEIPNLLRLGWGNIDGTSFTDLAVAAPEGCFGKAAELSRGKDTTTGHWEIAGLRTEVPFKTYPNGFPQEFMDAYQKAIGIECLGNYPASGTEIIARLGEEHQKTGFPIVYTSADSVFQIAAHEDVVPVETLYRWCEAARTLFDENGTGIGRVIARPFIGTPGHYTRTARRHDYAAVPPGQTMLDLLQAHGIPTHAVGKPFDIFAGRGFSSSEKTVNNADGLAKTLAAVRAREGLIFANILDFDMVWGHRRNVRGYANGLAEVDQALPGLMEALGDGLLIVTADHGCDPTWRGSDHTREYIPALIWHRGIAPRNLGTRRTFADIGATLLDWFHAGPAPSGSPLPLDG